MSLKSFNPTDTLVSHFSQSHWALVLTYFSTVKVQQCVRMSAAETLGLFARHQMEKYARARAMNRNA